MHDLDFMLVYKSRPNVKPLALEFFLPHFNRHRDNFLHIFTWHGVFLHSYCLARTFLVFDFRGLCFLVPPLSKIQSKCTYTIFKAKNQETQFPSICNVIYTYCNKETIRNYAMTLCFQFESQ